MDPVTKEIVESILPTFEKVLNAVLDRLEYLETKIEFLEANKPELFDVEKYTEKVRN